MKDGLGQTIGRRIAAVVVAKNEKRPPHQQVFLVFSDGTSFEFYGDSFTCCAGVDSGADVERYVLSAGGAIQHVYGASLDRDLVAWQTAKDVIARAMTPTPDEGFV